MTAQQSHVVPVELLSEVLISMRLISRFSHGVMLACATAASTPAIAQNPPLRVISKPDLEYAEPFTCVSGIRELSDGRIIVSDVREKTVQLIDLRTGKSTKIGREGQGPGEWATPQALFALPGDTTLLWDPQNGRFLTIHPDGSVGKEMTVDLGGGIGGRMMASLPRGADAMGRLYYQGSSFTFGGRGSAPTEADSVPVLRYDRRTAKVDTLGFLPAPRTTVQTSAGGANTRITVSSPNPFTPQRAWAVAPDGRVAFISPEPYRVEWLSTAKTRTAGPAINYERQRLTEADKAPMQLPNCGFSVTLGDGPGGAVAGQVRQTVTAVAGGGGGAPQRDDYPEYKPPFLPRYGAPIVAPNGELWVGRSRGPNDPPVYDVFDARGQLTSRVQLPKGTRISGFGKGTLYLFRMDDDDLVYLQRYRLDQVR